MTLRTATLWIATTVIAMCLAIVWDEPSETDAAQATALDLQDARLAAVAATKERK